MQNFYVVFRRFRLSLFVSFPKEFQAVITVYMLRHLLNDCSHIKNMQMKKGFLTEGDD